MRWLLIGLGGAASTQLKPSHGLAVMTSGSLAFKVLSELKADPVIRDFIGDSAAWGTERGSGGNLSYIVDRFQSMQKRRMLLEEGKLHVRRVGWTWRCNATHCNSTWRVTSICLPSDHAEQ